MIENWFLDAVMFLMKKPHLTIGLFCSVILVWLFLILYAKSVEI